jgi:UDP-N-acetyl-L-fucosamine synthase
MKFLTNSNPTAFLVRCSIKNLIKLKVLTIVGTRPEIIRLSRVINRLDQYCDHILVHTGQNYDYELNEVFFKDLDIRKPDHYLNAAGANASETIGKIIIAVDELLQLEKPEALLILGDTNSCLAVIPAKRRQIPIFHMESGNRCFDQRVPEETNRRIVDHVSDINMPYSDIGREYLIREGFPANQIIKTGSPMFEVLNHYSEKIIASEICTTLQLEQYKYFVVSAHREENIESEKNFKKLVKMLNGLAEKFDSRIIVSTHPRTRKRIESSDFKFHKHIELRKPLGFTDYMNLQINSQTVLSDSGTITEESSILNFPALNLRDSHERPEGMEEASVMMTGFNLERVLQGLEIIKHQPRGKERMLREISDYSMPNVSEKVVRIIMSYTNFVNRVVWMK